MLELLKNHRNHSVDRAAFLALMVQQHNMTPEGVDDRINEGIRLGYVEDLGLVDGTVRGKERINEDLDYIRALASKYQARSLQKLSQSSSSKQATSKRRK